jgi:hypothetical protein
LRSSSASVGPESSPPFPSAELLERALAYAPRFDDASTPETVARAVCESAVDAFGAVAALLVRRLDTGHIAIEHRRPSSTLLPPGRTFRISNLPNVAAVVRKRGPVLLSPEPPVAGAPVLIQGQVARVLVLDWGPDLDG